MRRRICRGSPYGAHGTQIYNLFNKARIFERVYQLPPLLAGDTPFFGRGCGVELRSGAYRLPRGGGAGAACGRLPHRSKPSACGVRTAAGASQAMSWASMWSSASAITPTRTARRALCRGAIFIPLREPIRDTPLARVIEAPRGSVLIFNICAWHGASEHRGGRAALRCHDALAPAVAPRGGGLGAHREAGGAGSAPDLKGASSSASKRGSRTRIGGCGIRALGGRRRNGRN